MNKENNLLAFDQLIDRAQVRGHIEGVRRFYRTLDYIKSSAAVECLDQLLIKVPPEFANHPAEDEYLLAEVKGYHMALIEYEKEKKRIP
jgi:hypothetical protein